MSGAGPGREVDAGARWEPVRPGPGRERQNLERARAALAEILSDLPETKPWSPRPAPAFPPEPQT